MTTVEMKAALKDAKIVTKGLNDTQIEEAYTRLLEDEDDEDESPNGDFASFLAARKAGGRSQGKIYNQEGTGGVNPFNFPEKEVLGDVLSVEEHVGPKGPINKLKIAVKGASVGFVYSKKNFKVDDLVIVTCRLLPEGTYQDADKDDKQRELVVGKGRVAAYAISDIKMASVVRLQCANIAAAVEA